MEPLKPEARRDLLNRPQASPQDVEEYERLLSQRYSRDPNPMPGPGPAMAPAEAGAREDPEARLRFLHKKLYNS